MIKHLQKRFELSKNGAKEIAKAIIFSFLVYVASMICVMALMFLSDMILLGNHHSKAFVMSFCVISLVLLLVLLYYEYDLSYKATYKESETCRLSVFKKLKDVPYSYFAKKDLSDLAQIIMHDIKSVENCLSHSVPKFYALCFFIPLLMIMLLLGDIWLGLAVVLPSLFRFLLFFINNKDVKSKNQKFYEVLRANSKAYQECIELNEVIKSFNKTDIYKQKLEQMINESEKCQVKANNASILSMSASIVFSFVSLAVVLIVASYTNASAIYTLGYMLAAIKLSEMIDVSSKNMLEIFYIDPRVARLKEIREQKIDLANDYELKSFDVEFKNVNFSYDEKPVLSDVSFRANAGEITALVGFSGCGKSTILKLISKLIKSDGVYIGGKNINEISSNSLYEKVSIVFQDVLLFNTSILENVRFGKKDASDDEVLKALELANCMGFVNDLPDGVHMIIGENGQLLSGGQRQRLSIARAFLKNAKVLILDEITSSLDSQNEKAIQQSLAKLVQGRTTFVVSHRLGSIKNADKIVVLDSGKIDAVGTHDELIKSSKVYKKLNDLANQTNDFEF